jgi:DNA-binding beta-propeller fold protein YncE
MKSVAHVIALTAAALVAAADSYHVLGKVQIGGEGGWDYLTMDSAAHRLYVSHATKTVVVDVDSEKVVGEIPDTPGVHGIAVAPELNRGWTSNGRGNNVTVFDLNTLKASGHIGTGQNPDAIQYDAPSKRVFTFNGRSKDATVIDASSGNVVGTIPLGGKPEFSASDGKGKVYVNIEDTHEVAEIDAAKGAVSKRYVLEGCEEPSGLAMDTKGRRIFSVCGNKVMLVSDPDAGKVIATVPIGGGADGAGFDPGSGLAFSSNGEDGTLTVVRKNGNTYEVVETVKTAKGARTMTVDAKTHKLYLSMAQYGPTRAATTEKARPRPPILPGSFSVLVVGQ